VPAACARQVRGGGCPSVRNATTAVATATAAAAAIIKRPPRPRPRMTSIRPGGSMERGSARGWWRRVPREHRRDGHDVLEGERRLTGERTGPPGRRRACSTATFGLMARSLLVRDDEVPGDEVSRAETDHASHAGAIKVRTALTRPSRIVRKSTPRATGLPGGPKRHASAAESAPAYVGPSSSKTSPADAPSRNS
jgi:hypothetical protein